MNKIPSFSSEQLTALCKVIGDPDSGLTGTEIGHALGDTRIPDIDAANTKWKRLYKTDVTGSEANDGAASIVTTLRSVVRWRPEVLQ